MKTSSCKAKGRTLQNLLRVKLLQTFPQLEPDDCLTSIMGESGTDIKLSPAGKKIIPYSFECKNQEKLSLYKALQQAEDNTKPNTEPVLVFKRNRSKTYAVVELDTFLALIKK
jgi:hypothetical protein